MEQYPISTRAAHQVPLHTVGLEAKLPTHTPVAVQMQQQVQI